MFHLIDYNNVWRLFSQPTLTVQMQTPSRLKQSTGWY